MQKQIDADRSREHLSFRSRSKADLELVRNGSVSESFRELIKSPTADFTIRNQDAHATLIHSQKGCRKIWQPSNLVRFLLWATWDPCIIQDNWEQLSVATPGWT